MKHVPLKDVLAECERRRIFHVELSGPHPFEDLEGLKNLLLEYKAKGFSLIPHNYFPPQKKSFVLNLASLDTEIQALNQKLIHESLTLAQAVGAPLYGIHAGYLSDGEEQPDGMFKFNDEHVDYASALEQMAKFVSQMIFKFKANGVTLVLENLFPTGKKNSFLACSFEQIEEVMSVVPKEVGLLLDLGHANISSNLLGFNKYNFLDKYLSKFDSRLCEVHLSENNGEIDEHLPLTKDSWQLDVLKDIASIPMNKNFQRLYCLEARNSRGFEPIQSSMEWIEERINLDPTLYKGAEVL